MDNRPIAVFDSGLGGLSVWKELRKLLPQESIIYFGDGKNCPYGDKSPQEVAGYINDAVNILVSKGIKMLVLACNAATAVAVDQLRETYDFPIIGMEPAVKPAATATKSGVIGILATAATLKGKLYIENQARYADHVRIIPAVGEKFVELVESGMEHSNEAIEAVSKAITPMLEAGADHIVLGCTHYPFLAQTIRRVIGNDSVTLVDPAPAIARRAGQILEQYDIAADIDNIPDYSFMTSADNKYLEQMISKSEETVVL